MAVNTNKKLHPKSNVICGHKNAQEISMKLLIVSFLVVTMHR